MTDAGLFITFVVTSLIVIIGWWVVHRLTVDRDSRNREAQMVTGYLVETYEKIANYGNIDPEKLDKADWVAFARMLETAVAKVQLFGTPEQIRLLHDALDQWAETEKRTGKPSISVDAMLFDLRNDLRKRLSLCAVNSPVRWVRPLGDGPARQPIG